MSAKYSTSVDPVVYGPATEDFGRADWLRLALAALDQAGLRPEEYASITAIANAVPE